MSKIMSEQSFSPEAEAALYSKLEEIARPHVEKSNGQLSILPHDLEEYPAQALGVFYVEGQLMPPATTDYIDSKAMPRFVEMSYGLMDSSVDELPLRQEVERLLTERQSIVVDTDHDDVTSPAYALGGFTNALRKANAYRPIEDKLQFESGIIVSKMLSVLAYEVKGQAIPCMQVLMAMCDRVYLTYPRTKTFLGAGLEEILPPEHTTEHNAGAKADIDEWMTEGAVILGESLLGSTHRSKEDGTVHELARVTKGSAEMVTRDHIHLLPVIVGLTEADRYMQRIGPLQQPKTLEDVHSFSEQMAAARTKRNRARGSQVICIYQTAEQAEEERRQLQTR
jgi:hypothetical protein